MTMKTGSRCVPTYLRFAVALDPAIDRAALHTRILGDDGNRLAFCDLGNRRPKAAIKSGVVRLRKRSQGVDDPSN